MSTGKDDILKQMRGAEREGLKTFVIGFSFGLCVLAFLSQFA